MFFDDLIQGNKLETVDFVEGIFVDRLEND